MISCLSLVLNWHYVISKWLNGIVKLQRLGNAEYQVRVFNVHIQSKLLLRTPVTGTGTGRRSFLCPGQEKKGRE